VENYSTDLLDLQRELLEIGREKSRLNKRRREIIKELTARDAEYLLHKRKVTIRLYVLELEHDCWYVGFSSNPEKRFKKHLRGSGANWTKLHKPIEIHTVRETKLYLDSEAAQLENELTLDYARNYGTDKVRGGGYCQTKPPWPKELFE